GIEVVEAAGEQVRVHGCKFEAAVAQVDRGVDRRLVLEPLRAEPALDFRPLVEHLPLEFLQRAGEGGREGRDHGRMEGKGQYARGEDNFTRSVEVVGQPGSDRSRLIEFKVLPPYAQERRAPT